MQNDQFEQAVICSLGNVTNQALKTEATAYCEQVRLSDNGWQLCAQRFVDLEAAGSNEDLVRFFCLHVIENALKTKFDTQPKEALLPINDLLMRWLSDKGSKIEAQSYVWNKFAYLFVLLFKRLYVTHANMMMSELIELIAKSRNRSRMADMFIRVCTSIHEDIVTRDISRTSEECKLSVDLKDVMRDTCVTNMVDAWAFILLQCQDNVSLITDTLNVVAQYVSWIESSLIVNDRFIPVIFAFLNVPDLRQAACQCVGALVIKGMNPDEKLDLIKTLGLLDAIPTLAQRAADDEDFMDELAKLVEILGNVVLACLDKLEKAQKDNNSYTTVSGVRTLSPDQMAAAMDNVWNQLSQCSSLMFVFLGNEIDDVTISVCGFAQAYLSNVLKPKIKAFTAEDTVEKTSVKDQLKRYLTVITQKLRFGSDFNHVKEGEDEIFFRDLRKTLLLMFGNIAVVQPDMAIQHVCNVVGNMLSALSSRPETMQIEDVEVALLLLYQLLPSLQSANPNQDVYGPDPQSHPVFIIVSQLVMSPVHKSGHKAVSLIYFDCLARYHKVLEMNKSLIPYLLDAFFSDTGIGNPNLTVQSQVCYRFSRVCAHLRGPLVEYCDTIVSSLLPLLAPDTPTSPNSPVAQKAVTLCQNDKCWLYEGASMLIFQLPGKEKTNEMLSKLCQPLLSVCTEILNKQLYNNETEEEPIYSQLLLNTTETLTRVAKAANPSSESGAFWVASYRMFIPVCTIPHLQPNLRKEFIKFSHRLVASIDDVILPEIPTTLSLLLQTDDPEIITESLLLLTQLMLTFKGKFKECIDLMLMGILQSVFKCFNAPHEENDMDHAMQLLELKRMYYKMMLAIAVNGLASTMYSPTNVSSLQQLLGTMLEGVRDYTDCASQKMAINFFQSLSNQWLGVPATDEASIKLAEASVDFRAFVLDVVLPAIFTTLLTPEFQIDDAQTGLQLTNAQASYLKDLEKKLGPDFHVYLGNAVLPAVSVPPQLAMGLAMELGKTTNNNAFRKVFRLFLRQARAQR
eukprot:CFRG4329T1